MTAKEKLRSEVRANLIFIGVILVGIPLGLAVFALFGSWPSVDGTVTVGGVPRPDAQIFRSPDKSQVAVFIDQGLFSVDLVRKGVFAGNGEPDVLLGRLVGRVGGINITTPGGKADHDAKLEISGNKFSFTELGGERVTVVLD